MVFQRPEHKTFAIKLSALFVFFLLFVSFAATQETAPPPDPKPQTDAPAQPASTPAVAESDDDISTEASDPQAAAANYAARAAAAQSRLDAVPSEVADETIRARVAEQWKDAVAGWQTAAQAADQYARRRQTVESAPARIQAIQGEIEALRSRAATAAQADATHTIADLETELRDLDVNTPEWTKQLNQRISRIETQNQCLAESRQSADEAQARLAEKLPPIPDALPPELKAATREARAAHLRADHEIIAGSDYFRNIQEPLAQLDAAERDLLTRRIEAGRLRREELSNHIADKRRDEAEALRRESEAAAARFLEALPPSFQEIATENRELSTILDKFLEREKERVKYLQSMTEYNQTLQTDYDRIREQLQTGNSGQALGSYLWAKRRSLQREAYQADQARDKFAETAVSGFTISKIDELRRRIPRLEQELTAFSTAPETTALSPFRREQLLEQARKLLDNHTKLVTGLSESSQRRSATLIDLDSANKELHRISGRYAALVERYVLHLPGSPPLWRISFVETFRDSLTDLSNANLWRSTAEALVYGVARSPWLLLFLLLSALPGLVARVLAGWLASFNITARKPVPASPKGLLWRAGQAFLRSYPVPLALFTAGAAIWSAARPGSDAAAVGEALLAGALPWLLLNLWRRFCASDGILELYAKMPRILIDRLYRRLTSILTIGLPLWIVVWFVQNRTEPPVFQALGGIVSLILAALAVSFWWLRMRPAVFLRGSETRSPLSWRVLHLVIMALCLLWLVMSLLGYNYGALLVIAKAVSSSLIITAVAIAAQYWSLRLTRSRERQRARAILYYRFSEERRRQREERQREANTGKTATVQPDPSIPVAKEEEHFPENDELNLADHKERDPLTSPAVSAAAVSIPPTVEKELDDSLTGSRKLVRWLSLALLTIILLLQWSDLFPVQEWLAAVTLFSRGDVAGLTLRSLVRAIAGGILFCAIANPLGSWANLSFFGWNPAERGTRMATSALIRYGILGIGVIWVAKELGMAWSDAQWLVAALSVGLGFGLQEIILNFVSGIILLFERPVRVGDMVTIGSAEGTISRINIRTTTIIDSDRRELIIPNKELVTGRVVNWTLSDSVTRVVISVGVAYGSDLELVQDLLVRAARFTDGVLDDPGPSVYFTSMGESSLNFDLRVYTGRLEDRVPVQHALRLTINRMFKRNNISIPFPQIDVHMVPPKQ